MDSAQAIYKYLRKANTQVVDVITHGEYLQKEKDKLNSVMKQYVTGEWWPGKLAHGTLTIIVAKAVDSQRLRYQSANILKDLSKLMLCEPISKIEIKIRPENNESTSPQKASIKPIKSSAGSDQLESLAKAIEDPELKNALRRLSKHLSE